MDLRVDLQHSLTCDEAPRSHAPVVFKFPRDEQVLDDSIPKNRSTRNRFNACRGRRETNETRLAFRRSSPAASAQ
jgi:hypothetical protein